MKRWLVWVAAILIVVNAATAPETTGSAGAVSLALVLGVLLYLTVNRRSWLAWLLLETVTATLGIVTAGAIGRGSTIAVAGALLLAITATAFRLEPGRATRSVGRSLASDRSIDGGHVTVSDR